MEDGKWIKSSRSLVNNCVEARRVGDFIQVRDSKHPDGCSLAFTRAEWDAFIAGAADGEFS